VPTLRIAGCLLIFQFSENSSPLYSEGAGPTRRLSNYIFIVSEYVMTDFYFGFDDRNPGINIKPHTFIVLYGPNVPGLGSSGGQNTPSGYACSFVIT
jgi:hypothetical protein